MQPGIQPEECSKLMLPSLFCTWAKEILAPSSQVPETGLGHPDHTLCLFHAVFTNRVEDMRLQDLAEGDSRALITQVC